MGDPVYTKLDLCIDGDLMDCTVHRHFEPNCHKVVTRWTMKADLYIDGVKVASAGEMMREDAAPSILAGPGQRVLQIVQGKMNGGGSA